MWTKKDDIVSENSVTRLELCREDGTTALPSYRRIAPTFLRNVRSAAVPLALTCKVPYRLDIPSPPADSLDLLVQLGALDVEEVGHGLAAILPDGLTQEALARVLGVSTFTVSTAVPRDNGSVWLLSPRTVRIGGILIAAPESASAPETLRLIDSPAFGTGHHPTTALCLEALAEIVGSQRLDSVLDVGTGSGILALAALRMGVPQAVGLDIDVASLKVAAENARLNNLSDRLQLVLGGPEVLDGAWPLVMANLLAAPLIEMAPLLVRRVRSGGKLLLSGVRWSLESEVKQAYQHVGIRHVSSQTHDGWSALIADVSW